MIRCEFCGWESEDESLEEHIEKEHHISYQRYYERIISGGVEEPCWRCGYPRYLISPHLTDYLPCEACGQGCSRRIFEERRRDVLGIIEEYLGSLGKNRYHQYLLAYSGIDWILGGLLQTGLDLLGRRKKDLKLRLDKTAFPMIEFESGHPKEISERNLSHVILGLREDIKVSSGEGYFKATIGNKTFLIWLPEVIEFDTRYHSRHSILNPLSNRPSKRLKLKSQSGDYIKIYGRADRTILKLTTEDSEELSFSSLPKNIQNDLKLIILSWKPIRERIIEVYNEILIYCEYVYDLVFMLSSFSIPSTKDFRLYLTWTPSEIPGNIEEKGENIKLSII